MIIFSFPLLISSLPIIVNPFAVPSTYSNTHNLTSGDIIEVDITFPYCFYSFVSTKTLTVEKLQGMNESFQSVSLISIGTSSTIGNFGFFERSYYRLRFIVMENMSVGDFSITTAKFDGTYCDELFISNHQIVNFSFSSSKKGFFGLPITERRCIFIASPGDQKISAYMGECRNCPMLDVYNGEHHRIGYVTTNIKAIIESVNENPMYIVIKPSASQSDLDQLTILSDASMKENGLRTNVLMNLRRSASNVEVQEENVQADGYVMIAFALMVIGSIVVAVLIKYADRENEVQTENNDFMLSSAILEMQSQYTPEMRRIMLIDD